MRIEFTFKSGTKVQAEVESFSHVAWREWTWESIEDTYPKLLKIRLDDVVAVTRLS
jgi:hypothetical protein